MTTGPQPRPVETLVLNTNERGYGALEGIAQRLYEQGFDSLTNRDALTIVAGFLAVQNHPDVKSEMGDISVQDGKDTTLIDSTADGPEAAAMYLSRDARTTWTPGIDNPHSLVVNVEGKRTRMDRFLNRDPRIVRSLIFPSDTE